MCAFECGRRRPRLPITQGSVLPSFARESLTLVAFDLDGTLVDSRRDIADAANELLVACGAQPLEEAVIGRMVGDGAATLVARAFHAVLQPPPHDALSRFLAYYAKRVIVHTRPYPGILHALQTLAERYQLAVLTNKPLAPTRAILDGLGLMSYFKPGLIVAGDGPYPRKPDPSGLRALAAALDTTVDGACLVGDSLIDLATARAAGAACCLVRWGFGFETVSEGLPEDEFDRVVAVDSPAQLVQLL